MFNGNKRKEARINSDVCDTISLTKYNMILGFMFIYGFLMNALLVKFVTNLNLSIKPWIILIGYFVLSTVGTKIVNQFHKPVWSFVGYNMICIPIGAVLSICFPKYDPNFIISAIVVTAVVTVTMMLLGIIFSNLFAKRDRLLLISLFVGIVAESIAMLLGYGGDVINWLFVVLFSLYISYDWNKAQQYPKTVDNAIDSAVDLYLNFTNLFVNRSRKGD